MKTQDRLLLIAGVVLVIVAVVITFIPGPATVGPDTTEAEELLKKTIGVGKGQTDYYYSYSESNDGYVIDYTLLVRGDEKMLDFSNPISEKELYLLSNDTIFCVDFMNVRMCSSVKNTTEPMFHSYLLSLQSKFFDDSTIEMNMEQMDYFMENGYVEFSPVLVNKTVNGHGCTEISYVTDLTNLTVGEAARFSISPTSPKVFSWNMCIDDKTGIAYSKHFNYSYRGKQYYWDFELIDYEWYTNKQITPPENLTEGAYDVLLEESEWKNELQRCYSGDEEDKDRCISLVALQLKMKSICDLAGERRDRCLVSIVALTLDESICMDISDAGYKDDCYIEMAGGTKNSTYCSMIANSSKVELCMNVSQSMEENETAGIPNPAAVNCADKGYGYEIRKDNETGGEYGVCIYEGLECEEWALFREECCLTDADCLFGNCTDQKCPATGEETAGNETNSTVDMQKFLDYLENFSEDNETNESESS